MLRKKSVRKFCAAAILGLFLLSPGVLSAGWVDDWVTQRTATGGGYFAGQKRGYYQGGSFNMRWPNSGDYLMTIEPPRVKSGCGGIDTFLGGFSFLDFEYLVEKLQRILMNGGAVAFDLALSTLCEQCSTSIKSFEAMVDKLNSLQLDECSMGKEFKAVLKEDGFSAGALGNALKRSDLGQGVADLWTSLTEEHKTTNDIPPVAQAQRAVAGCNDELKAIFLSNLAASGSSLMDNVGVAKLGMPQDYIDMIRGLIGDIRIEASDKTFRVSYVSPCPANDPSDIKAFLEGHVQKKGQGENGICSEITDANRDLVRYVQDQMTAVAASMKTKSATLTSSQVNFIENSPVSIGLVLKTAVGTEQEAATIGSLSDLTAKAYVLQALSDLYQRALYLTLKAKEALDKKSVARTGEKAEACNAEIFADDLVAKLVTMQDTIFNLQQAAKQSYTASAQEMSTIITILKDYQNADRKLKNELGKHFPQDVVARLVN